MAEDVEHDVGRTAVGHPVFRVDQQRLAGPGEQALDDLDQFDAEHRRRRDDDHCRFVEQGVLQLAEGFPVHQARGTAEGAFAAPAAGAGVEYQ
ncbi:hypothetical protein D3C86_1743690 [compost metagenome]